MTVRRLATFLLVAIACLVAPAVASADTLTITENSKDPLTFGDTIKYTVNVTGSTGATTVTMTVPPNTTLGSACGQSGLPAGTQFTCDSKSFVVLLEPEGVGQISFTATSSQGGTDTETTTVNPRANKLDVTLTGPAETSTGQVVTYTARVDNLDTVRAKGVTLIITRPDGTTETFDLGEIKPSDPVVERTVTWTAGAEGLYTAQASVTSATTSGARGASTTTKVAGPPTDLQLTSVVPQPNPALVGNTITYTINVTNAGDNPSTAQVKTTLPANMVYEAGPPTCTTGGTPVVVTCPIGTIAAHSSTSIALKVNTTAIGDYTVTSTVDGSAADAIPNNSATVTFPVAPKESDIAVGISDPGPVLVGSTFVLNFFIDNPSVAVAESTRLDIVIPAGVTLLQTSGDERTNCGTIGGAYSCGIGRVGGNGGRRSVTLTLRADQLGNLPWSATATTATKDPNAANNTTSRTVSVVSELPQPTPTPTPTPTPKPGGGGGGGGGGKALKLTAAVDGTSFKARKGVPVVLGVSRKAAVELVLAAGKKVLATKADTLRAGSTETLKVKLAKAGRRALARMRTGKKLTLTITATPAGGGKAVTEELVLRVAKGGRLKAA